jgi:outer membrane lipopolysaccharide assembly protein LptE/RlpB
MEGGVMDLEKKYYPLEGGPVNILQAVKREPEWAAIRIQNGEAYKKLIKHLRKQINNNNNKVQDIIETINFYVKTEHIQDNARSVLVGKLKELKS